MSQRTFSEEELEAMSPQEFHSITRRNGWAGNATEMICRGYCQVNLAIVPKDMAFDLIRFCERNPRPNYLLEVTEPGDPCPRLMAPDADLRTDLSKYRVYQDGKLVDEPTDISSYWRDDMVAFLIACSHTFDWVLKAANVKYRRGGAYKSSIECAPAGCIHGHMVVSSRFFEDSHNAVRAVQISSRHLAGHGAPVHIGDSSRIGIKDVCHPDIWSPGDAVPLVIAPKQPDEVVMYWGCGITPQVAAMESKLPFMITHRPGNMFITNWLSEELALL